MIGAADTHLAEVRDHLRERVEFAVGDALSLDENDASYDAVISIRVMISPGEWPNQLRGLSECVRVLKPGGQFFLSEATLQGWRRLNLLRREWDLSEIAIPDFNNYPDESVVVAALDAECELTELANFASTYFVGTGVLKPLLAQAAESEVDAADPTSELIAGSQRFLRQAITELRSSSFSASAERRRGRGHLA